MEQRAARFLVAGTLAATSALLVTPLGCGSNGTSPTDGGSLETESSGSSSGGSPETGSGSGGADAGVAETGSSRDSASDSDSAPANTAEMPGISPALFASPYYQCAQNFFVATTGSDDNDGTTATTGGGHGPWLTIQHANDSLGSGGACVNLASGTYPVTTSITLSHGGSAATPTGYVVYRSSVLGGAVVRATAPLSGSVLLMYASYLVLDGLEVDGNATGCSGLPCSGDYNIGLGGATFHHSWITNTYTHGGGGGGIGAGAAGDCMWFIHNVSTDNSATSTYAESGISIWEPSAVSGVTSCGSSSFHMQILWNISANNVEGSTIPAADHTDGDGVIMDTFTAHAYGYPSLVANNVAYGNGAFCIGEDNSSNITFANNTCYKNYQDTMNLGTYRGEIFNNGGSNDAYINNVIQSIPGAGVLANNVTALSAGSATGTTWSRNVFFGPDPVDDTSGHVAPVSNASNKLATDPLWVSAATDNFALKAGSPALGYGTTESYLPATAVDVGACSGTLGTCPQLAF